MKKPSPRALHLPRLLPTLQSSELDLREVRDEHLHGIEVVGRDALDVAWSGVEVSQSRFLASNLRGAQLHSCSFTDVVFEQCDLSGLRFDDGSLLRVAFRQCRMEGATFQASSLFDTYLADSKLALANFRFLKKLEAWVHRCALNEADFTGSDLRKLTLLGCDCTGVDVTNAQLEGTDLRGNELLQIRGVGALRGAIVDHGQLISLLPQLAAEAGMVVSADERPAFTVVSR